MRILSSRSTFLVRSLRASHTHQRRHARALERGARLGDGVGVKIDRGSGLTKTSFALIDHLRSIDKRRIRRVFGRVTLDELAAVDQGLELFLGLTAER